jgi:predicted ester cyclase
MSEANKTLATRFVHEFLNTGDPAALDALTIPGYVDHDLPSGMTPRQSISMFRAGFPDATFRVQDAIAENDRVVVRYAIDATHTGEFFGMPPSARPVHLEGISIYRVAAGRLAEAWVQYDRAGLIQQLQPAPTAPNATPGP